jgi:hypothetical protein
VIARGQVDQVQQFKSIPIAVLAFACASPATPPLANTSATSEITVFTERCKTFGERVGRLGGEVAGGGQAKRTEALREMCARGDVSDGSIQCAHDPTINDLLMCIDLAPKTPAQDARWRRVWDDWYY